MLPKEVDPLDRKDPKREGKWSLSLRRDSSLKGCRRQVKDGQGQEEDPRETSRRKKTEGRKIEGEAYGGICCDGNFINRPEEADAFHVLLFFDRLVNKNTWDNLTQCCSLLMFCCHETRDWTSRVLSFDTSLFDVIWEARRFVYYLLITCLGDERLRWMTRKEKNGQGKLLTSNHDGKRRRHEERTSCLLCHPLNSRPVSSWSRSLFCHTLFPSIDCRRRSNMRVSRNQSLVKGVTV